MYDNKTLPSKPPEDSVPRTQDVDDLIFQGEGWLASDR